VWGSFKVIQGDLKRPRRVLRKAISTTGDGGYMDEEGELYIIDRVRDMQTTKTGEKVFPTYTEGRLNSAPLLKMRW